MESHGSPIRRHQAGYQEMIKDQKGRANELGETKTGFQELSCYLC